MSAARRSNTPVGGWTFRLRSSDQQQTHAGRVSRYNTPEKESHVLNDAILAAAQNLVPPSAPEP